MRKSVTVRCHDLAGHFGLDRTVARIKEYYWFPGMRRYVKHHITHCFECFLVKVPGGRKPGLLNPIPPGTRPFQIVHMDHLGPFPRSSRGNKDLLVLVDNLTKFVHLYAVRDTSTKNVLKKFEEFVLERGLPERVITDRGTCYTSKAFVDYCESHGISHTLNSSRHPQANGQVERVNRTVLPLITISIERNDHRDWDKQLKIIQTNLNTAVNKTTNRTPFEILHGYKPRFHDGALRVLTDTLEHHQWRSPTALQDETRTHILENQPLMKKYYDRKHCGGDKLQIGEIVAMLRAPNRTGQPTKAQEKFRGPLVVTGILPGDTYRVTQLDSEDAQQLYVTTAHISQLKSWGWKNGIADPDAVDVSDDPGTREEVEDNGPDVLVTVNGPEVPVPVSGPGVPIAVNCGPEVPDAAERSMSTNAANNDPEMTTVVQKTEEVNARPSRHRRRPRHLADFV